MPFGAGAACHLPGLASWEDAAPFFSISCRRPRVNATARAPSEPPANRPNHRVVAIPHAAPRTRRRHGPANVEALQPPFPDRVTGPGTQHPPPRGGRRALERVDTAPPLLASTRSAARLASGLGSFAGARLLLPRVGGRGLARRGPLTRTACASSGAGSLGGHPSRPRPSGGAISP